MQAIPRDGAEPVAVAAGEDHPGARTLVIATTAIVVAFLIGGVLAAVLWVWFADPPYAVVEGDNAYQNPTQLGRQFGVDAAFTWASLVVAVPLGVVFGLRWHRLGWPVAVVLMLAATAASVVAWWLGGILGPDDPLDLLATAHDGERLHQPLDIAAKGLFLTAPVGAVSGFIAAVAALQQLDRLRNDSSDSQQFTSGESKLSENHPDQG